MKEELSYQDIGRMLPHKYPFLLVDRAFEIVPGVSGKGVKCVSGNEWYFQGHFPGNSIVPGCLIAESLAQLSAVIYIAEYIDDDDLSKHASKVGYLARMDMKFHVPVEPGSVLELHSERVRKVGKLFQFKVKATYGKKIVADGILNVSENDTCSG